MSGDGKLRASVSFHAFRGPAFGGTSTQLLFRSVPEHRPLHRGKIPQANKFVELGRWQNPMIKTTPELNAINASSEPTTWAMFKQCLSASYGRYGERMPGRASPRRAVARAGSPQLTEGLVRGHKFPGGRW